MRGVPVRGALVGGPPKWRTLIERSGGTQRQRREASASPTDRAVPEEWLDDPRLQPEREVLQRLEGDIELVSDLIVAGYQGPPWRRFANALAAYALPVIKGWLRTGIIYERCRQKRLGLFLPRGPIPELAKEDIEEIAQETIVAALSGFREEVLIPGLWDPRKRASLTTFFIGQCLIRFVAVFRKTVGEIRRRRAAEYSHPDLIERLRPISNAADPERTAIIRQLLDQERKKLPKVTVDILKLQADGFTQEEIAEMLEMSVGAVESRLYRHRFVRRQEDTA
jgi:DNA-directed RNA polymerase specialized sigma24 family protein